MVGVYSDVAIYQWAVDGLLRMEPVECDGRNGNGQREGNMSFGGRAGWECRGI